jgi:hypothetical protein
VRPIWLARAAVAALSCLLFLLAPQLARPAAAADIHSAGPLTQINISNDLMCDVRYAGDPSGEWWQELPSGMFGCGTLILVNGTLYGTRSVIEGYVGTGTDFPPGTTALSGSGTVADPFRSTTTVMAGSLQLQQVDSYVVGQFFYTTTVTLTNQGEVPATGILYTFGDCFLHGSDEGFGRLSGSSTFCAQSNHPNSRSLGLVPMTAGSHFQEGNPRNLEQRPAAHSQFTDTCECNTFVDNSVGLSWSMSAPTPTARLRAAADAGDVFQWRTQFTDVDVSLRMGFNPSIVDRGSSSQLAVAVKNHSSFDATDVVFRVTLPTGLTWPATRLPAGCARSRQVVTCTVALIPAGDPTFTFHVDTSTARSSLTTLAYQATGVVEPLSDADPSNNRATAVLRVRGELPITGQGPNWVIAGALGLALLINGALLYAVSRP